MIWAVIYVIGVGVFVLPTLKFLEQSWGGSKLDELEQAAAIAFALLIALCWPFFIFVAIPLAIQRGSSREHT